MDRDFEIRQWRSSACLWLLLLVIDAKTGFDILEGDATATDRRVALDIAAMRETLNDPGYRAGVRWVPGPHHLGDGLTKLAHNGVLPGVLSGHGWTLKEDAEVREGRQRRREQVRQRAAAGAADAEQPEQCP